MTENGSGHGKATRCGRRAPAAFSVQDILANFTGGLPVGTEVMTAEGCLPVEYLEPGDRVVTRGGLRVLRDIDTPAPGRFRLVFDRAEVVYAGGIQVMSDSGLPFAA